MDTETLIAHHVEALIGLGWRWEGRGLVPSLHGLKVTEVNSQMLAQESINHPLEES